MTLKKQKTIPFGLLKVRLTLNNLFITLTDINGNVLIVKHAGLLNFQGSKKKTPYVGGLVVKNLIHSLNNSNFKIRALKIQIIGFLQNSITNNIIKQLQTLSLSNLIYIEYINKYAHNGLRAKKKRRL